MLYIHSKFQQKLNWKHEPHPKQNRRIRNRLGSKLGGRAGERIKYQGRSLLDFNKGEVRVQRMKSQLRRIEQKVIKDARLTATIASYIAILLLFINLVTIRSPAHGLIASIVYLLINTVFIGHAFFSMERHFLRLMLGGLLLIAFARALPAKQMLYAKG